MSPLTVRFAGRAPYRRACAVLLLVLVGLPIVLAASDAPLWLCVTIIFLLLLPAYILLCVLTYHRLRDAWIAGGWIILMIISMHIGPGWSVSPNVTYRLGDAIALIPLLLAWFAPARSGANPLTG
jgi:uncharacterized membrane protein YhaH (DUF805 family)